VQNYVTMTIKRLDAQENNAVVALDHAKSGRSWGSSDSWATDSHRIAASAVRSRAPLLEPESLRMQSPPRTFFPVRRRRSFAIFCAWKLRAPGERSRRLGFICPGLLMISLIRRLLSKHPPIGVLGAAAGAGGRSAVALNGRLH